MEVVVEHDYIAKEPNELSIAKGDIIKDVIRKQGGWWEGTLNDKKGLFPDNFVKVIDKDPTVVLRNKKDVSRIRRCRVVFSYKQDHEDELNLKVGDIIDILGEEEEGWWRGILNGKEGVFPSNFVEEIPEFKAKSSSKENLTDPLSNDLQSHQSKPTKILCAVKFPYKAQNDDELSLKEGDLVTLISKDGQDAGWWKGELNGVVGVFPDNFVTVVPATDEKHTKEDKRAKSAVENTNSVKTSAATSLQRKSLESKIIDNKDQPEINKTPPIPGKKPAIPIKKSPSGSSATGGLFYGLKKKIVDVVDGATGSKSMSPPKTEPNNEVQTTESVFDEVVRRPLLPDVRASRPKAPGRRLPSAIGKEPEPGIVNGNAPQNIIESTVLANKETPITPAPIVTTTTTTTTEADVTDNKPKLREWEKHKAPWLDEMKLNQAKRTSTSPGPEVKPKVTSIEKNNPDNEESKLSKSLEKEPSPSEIMTKSAPGITTRLKTPPNETPVLRNKPAVPTPTRPQTIQNINNLSETHLQKSTISVLPKTSPLNNKTPSPLPKVEKRESDTAPASNSDTISSKHYLELMQRIVRLEEQLKQQQMKHEAAIEELKGKLQLETEMRIELQARFETFIAVGDVEQL